MDKTKMGRAALPAGRLVHIHGLPFYLTKPAEVEGHEANVIAAGLEPLLPSEWENLSTGPKTESHK